MPDDQLQAEIDRVGASYAKAGAARYIAVHEHGDEASITGPPNERPRRSWRGEAFDALAVLAQVPDDAGPDAVWKPLGQDRSPAAPWGRPSDPTG